MPRSIDARLAGVQGKPLAIRGEGLRKELAAADLARAVGRLIGQALRHADVTPQEAAHRMGYADQSALSRWMSGAEVPALLAKFLAHPDLRRGLVVALAEIKGDAVRVRTVVEIDHEAAS